MMRWGASVRRWAIFGILCGRLQALPSNEATSTQRETAKYREPTDDETVLIQARHTQRQTQRRLPASNVSAVRASAGQGAPHSAPHDVVNVANTTSQQLDKPILNLNREDAVSGFSLLSLRLQ